MKTSLKRVALALFLGAALTGCGGGNSTGGSNNFIDQTPTDIDALSGNSNGVRTFSAFIREVERGRFKDGSKSGYYYYQEVSSQGSTSSLPSNCSRKWGIFYYCKTSYSSTSFSSGATNLPWRRVSSNGDITRGNFHDDELLGDTLRKRRDALVELMRDATDSRKCLTSLQNCLNMQQIQTHCQSTTPPLWTQFGYRPDSHAISLCVESLENERTKLFVFDSNGYSYVVNLDKPIGANPTHIGKLNGNTIYVLAE
jgi:hypothetical protein